MIYMNSHSNKKFLFSHFDWLVFDVTISYLRQNFLSSFATLHVSKMFITTFLFHNFKSSSILCIFMTWIIAVIFIINEDITHKNGRIILL